MKKYFLKTVLFSFLVAFIACDNDENSVQALTVNIDNTANITYTSIEISGNVSNNGNNVVISRGICWSTSSNPTINDDFTSEASDTFTSLISNLTANTTYYFRTYATNSNGTDYSLEQLFTTSTLDGTTWDFLLVHDSNTSWHADVIFNANGTTVYDEPSSPGSYLSNGTWSLNGNILTYDLDSSDNANTHYQFTGTLLENTMSGTYTFGAEPNKNWSAVKY